MANTEGTESHRVFGVYGHGIPPQKQWQPDKFSLWTIQERVAKVRYLIGISAGTPDVPYMLEHIALYYLDAPPPADLDKSLTSLTKTDLLARLTRASGFDALLKDHGNSLSDRTLTKLQRLMASADRLIAGTPTENDTFLQADRGWLRSRATIARHESRLKRLYLQAGFSFTDYRNDRWLYYTTLAEDARYSKQSSTGLLEVEKGQ